MGFGPPVGEQRLLDTLTRNLPRIVTLLEHVAKSVDENNRLLTARGLHEGWVKNEIYAAEKPNKEGENKQ